MNAQTQPTNQLAPARPARGQVEKAKQTIEDALLGDRFKGALAKILPKHLTADRIVSITISAMTRTPDLKKCDPQTVFQSLMKLSALGLEPDGYQGHLIPFWNSKRSCFECVLIVDYKGMVEVAMRTGMFSQPPIAQLVCENDDFLWDRGTVVRHQVDWRRPRGEVYAAYVIVKTKNGGEIAHVMPRDEIEEHRARSKSPDKGPWKTDWGEMAKKTVFRQMSKWLPRSPEFRDTIEADVESFEQKRFEASKPIFDAPKRPQLFEGNHGANEGGSQPEGPGVGDDNVPFDDSPQSTPTAAVAANDTAPEVASPEQPPASEKDEAKRFLKAVKNLLQLSSISEVDLIAYLNKHGELPEGGAATLREMAEFSINKLREVHDRWSEYAAKIKEEK